jgi:hypothetical protein
MKLFLKFAPVAALAFGAAAMISCTGGGDDPKPEPEPEPVIPVITITTQPADISITVGMGAITENLTVAASVTEDATLSYQWYSNTSAANTGGTAIVGATNATFTFPADIKYGTYYYFCEVSATGGAAAVRSDVATVTVEEVTIGPPPQPQPNGTQR